MLQHMPKASPSASGGGSGEGGLLSRRRSCSGDEAENWNRVNMLLDTVEEIELIGPTCAHRPAGAALPRGGAARLRRAAGALRLHLSAEQVRQSLSIYSAKDIAHMTTEDGIVTADCQFCGAHYEFDPDAGLRGRRPGR